MNNCNYTETGNPVYKGTYDVRQEYKTECGIRHVNLNEKKWNGIESVSNKPKGDCIYCGNEINLI